MNMNTTTFTVPVELAAWAYEIVPNNKRVGEAIETATYGKQLEDMATITIEKADVADVYSNLTVQPNGEAKDKNAALKLILEPIMAQDEDLRKLIEPIEIANKEKENNKTTCGWAKLQQVHATRTANQQQ